MKLRVENNSVFMCCGKAKCPSVRKTKTKNKEGESLFVIKDDFGGEVVLSEAQALLVSEATAKASKIPE